MKSMYLSILAFVFATGCVSATLDDDDTMKKQLDFSSVIAQASTSQVSGLQAACKQLPAACSVPGIVPLQQEQDIDVSKQLKDFDSDKYGASYSLTDVVVEVHPTTCKGDCLANIGGITVTIGNCTLVDASHVAVETGKFNVTDTKCVKEALQAGPAKLGVEIDVSYSSVNAAVTALKTIPTIFDVKLDMHVEVNVEKSM